MPLSPTNDLTQGPVPTTLLRLSAPMMLGVSSSILVQMFEMYFIAQLGTLEIAALTFTFPLSMALSSIALGISIGTSSVVARVVGAKEFDSARRLATHSLLLIAGLMSVLSFLGWLFINPLFSQMGAQGRTLEMIHSYLTIAFVSFPFLTVMMVGGSVMRANGNAKIPGLAMTSASLLNLVLDPLLIFGLFGFPRLELDGAAWALGISRVFTCIAILYFLQHHQMLNLRNVLIGFGESCKQVLHIGVPAMATQLIGPISGAIITAMLASHGETVLAGFGIASRIEAVSVMLLFALSGSIGPFVGQNWGANQYQRAHTAVSMTYLFSLGWGLVALSILYLFGSEIVSLVDSDTKAVEVAVTYLSVVPLSYGAWGVLMMASASFNALGKPVPSTILSFLRMFIIYVPLALLLNNWYGYVGIFIATATANLIVASLGYFWFRSSFFGSGSPASRAA